MLDMLYSKPKGLMMLYLANVFLISKILCAVSAAIGGICVSFFWKPKNLHQYGPLAAGVIVGGISVSTSFALGGMIALYFHLDFTNIDVALGIGFCVGVMAIGVLNFVANFFKNRESKDISEVMKEVR